MTICISELKECLAYDPDTGNLWWKISRRGASRSKPAGGWSAGGYWKVTVRRKAYAAHNIAWAIYHGEWPNLLIDHINGNPQDNRIYNLRLATQSQNCMNRAKAKGRSSKYMGVFREKNGRPWRARIRVEGRIISLGRYDKEEDARDAYRDAKIKYHPFNPVVRDEE